MRSTPLIRHHMLCKHWENVFMFVSMSLFMETEQGFWLPCKAWHFPWEIYHKGSTVRDVESKYPAFWKSCNPAWDYNDIIHLLLFDSDRHNKTFTFGIWKAHFTHMFCCLIRLESHTQGNNSYLLPAVLFYVGSGFLIFFIRREIKQHLILFICARKILNLSCPIDSIR